MKSLGENLRGLVILSICLALSLGAAVSENAPVSVGTDVIKIISVNYLGVDQWIEMANEGTGSMNLTGWTLMNMENQTFSFPANFTLKAGSIFRVHAGKGNDTVTDLYTSALVLNTKSDTATLKDVTGKIISVYKYPIKVSAPKAGYKSDPGAERGGLKSSFPVVLSGHPFICHGGPLNWAWTTGLR